LLIASARYTCARWGWAIPKLKPEEVETRNREILDAARACFLRKGFHATSTDDICREASITPGGLYHYFGSKDELIAAVIEDAARQAVASLSALAEESANTRSSVRALSALVAQSAKNPDVETAIRLDFDIWAETLRNEKLANTTREAWRIRRGWLESLIKSGITEGYYSAEVDPRGLANLFMVMWLGLRVGRVLWREDFDADRTVQALAQMHTGRLLNPNGSRKAANGNGSSPRRAATP
jgi:TetR/AcrR family transcriptional regulator, repressor for uid operon